MAKEDSKRGQGGKRLAVLGLSFDYHDAAAAIIVDGKLVAAAQEERFTRIKHDDSLPIHSIKFCLKQAGLNPNDLDAVVHYENPIVKFDRILRTAEQEKGHPQTKILLDEIVQEWFQSGKFFVKERIASAVEVCKEKIRYVPHHTSHAASAFFCSPFQEATIVTLDGAGEYETATVFVGRGFSIEQCVSVVLPHSIGLLYSAFTAYLGFEVNEGEYKVMGMAAYGTPRYQNEIRELYSLTDDGVFKIKDHYFNFGMPKERPFNTFFLEKFGPPRVPESTFTMSKEKKDEHTRYLDIAASVQACTEEIIIHIVTNAIKKTGVKNVCLAGGVALNSLCNGRIEKEFNIPLYVHPAAGDSGGAVGSAAYVYHQLSQARMEPLLHASLGPSYSDAEVESAIRSSGYTHFKKLNSDVEVLQFTARALRNGNVVGWFQGRSEWGPRALGHRSILADPTRSDMQHIVNERIKHREVFRPFAPAVPMEFAHHYFEMPLLRGCSDPEYFMLAVHPVKEAMKQKLPGTTHVDGTARVQTVSKDTNPLFYELLCIFGELSGVPVLMNTSFNLRGEPIVERPEDAINTFSYCDMNYLVMNRYILSKEPLS